MTETAEQTHLSHDDIIGRLYDFFLSHPNTRDVTRYLKIKGTELDVAMVYEGRPVIIEVKTCNGESNGRQCRRQINSYESQFGIRPEYYKIYVNGSGMRIFKYESGNGRERKTELVDD